MTSRSKSFAFAASSLLRGVLLGCGIASASPAIADWHTGNVDDVAHDYNSVAAFRLVGYARTNCTCASAWNNYLCLDRARPSMREELALLLMARAQDKTVQVNIDETTCKVIAIVAGP